MVGKEPAHKHGSGPTFQSEIWKDWAIPNNCPTAEFKNIYRNIKISTPQKLKAHNAWHAKKQGQMSHDEKKTQLVKTDQEFTKAITGLGAQPSRNACLTCTGPGLNLQLHGNKKTIFDISTGFEERLSLSNTDMRGIKKRPRSDFQGQKQSHEWRMHWLRMVNLILRGKGQCPCRGCNRNVLTEDRDWRRCTESWVRCGVAACGSIRVSLESSEEDST